MESGYFTRAFPLEDIQIRSDGKGRTVVAYAAVFNTPAEVNDYDGHYYEIIRAGAFVKTLREGRGRIVPLYNHGRTISGMSSERYSMPLGTPIWDEMKEDARGLVTVTEYANTPLADEVLELIRANAITAQSFGGRFVKSTQPKMPVRPNDLPTIERLEIKLRDYGPTPFPAYPKAKITALRSASELAEELKNLPPEEQQELLTLINASTDLGAAGDGTQPDPPPANANTPDGAGDPPPTSSGPSVDLLTREQQLRRKLLAG